MIMTGLVSNINDHVNNAIAHANHAQLIALLDEGHAAYYGKSANEVVRIRGYILSSFKDIGLRDEAIPFVLQELESGKHAYLVAAAARALRGRAVPLSQACRYFMESLNNIAHSDDAVSFDDILPNNARKNQTSAFDEIMETIQWYGPHAQSLIQPLEQMLYSGPAHFNQSNKKKIANTINVLTALKPSHTDNCCDEVSDLSYSRVKKIRTSDLAHVQMEDQDQNLLSYCDYFQGKPTVTVFFYTRCENPSKCSLSVSKMGQLQKMLQQKGLDEQVKLAAITYDAVYDDPVILRNYCANRKLTLGDDVRAFRVTSGFDELKNYFRLGVNYVASVVNSHKIELYITDKDGNVRHSFTRVQWDNDAVIKKLESLLKPALRGAKALNTIMRNALSALVFLGIFFFPKCPFCMAAYASALGITGVNAFLLTAWAKYILAAGLSLNLFVIWRMCRKRQWHLPFYIGCGGAALIVAGAFYASREVVNYGVIAVLVASLANGVYPYRRYAGAFFGKIVPLYYARSGRQSKEL